MFCCCCCCFGMYVFHKLFKIPQMQVSNSFHFIFYELLRHPSPTQRFESSGFGQLGSLYHPLFPPRSWTPYYVLWAPRTWKHARSFSGESHVWWQRDLWLCWAYHSAAPETIPTQKLPWALLRPFAAEEKLSQGYSWLSMWMAVARGLGPCWTAFPDTLEVSWIWNRAA